MTDAVQKALTPAFPVPQEAVLEALPLACCLIDPEGIIRKTYGQAEFFFGVGEALLIGKPLRNVCLSDAAFFSKIETAQKSGVAFSSYDVFVRTRSGEKNAVVRGSCLAEQPEWLLVTFDERSSPRALAERTFRYDHGRAMEALALTLAHEIKNPLSGIRGAAQLLEQSVGPNDRTLTALICSEADRIVSLVNRMEVFSDERPLHREEVNIHYVLGHVKKIAENGFASHVRILENYDPSLPDVWGNRDALIQVFLNLVKNSAEALSAKDGVIILGTSYYREMKLLIPDADGTPRAYIPICISVTDNGPDGIPDTVRSSLFNPFVTTKVSGSGLGLPLVERIVSAHGGTVEFSSRPGETSFRVQLPLVPVGNDARRDNRGVI